jgi:hypothetical protein
VDTGANLCIADEVNNRIRVVINETIYTIAGNGRFGYLAREGGLAITDSLSYPAA